MSHGVGILIFGFNRPDMLQNQIEFALSTKHNVYVNLDGPDENNVEANRLCAAIVEKYKSNLTCIRISSVNKGCNLAVTDAITWAFESEKALIILEDDVRVDNHFLEFAILMLKMHESDKSIGGISAMNMVPHSSITNSDLEYRFTCFTSSWGWATWRDRWETHLQMNHHFPIWEWDFPKKFWNPVTRSIWGSFFSKTKNGEYDAWDFRWQYTNWLNKRLTIIPNKNLGLNLGFGSGATHTKSTEKPVWLPTRIEEISLPIEKQTSINQDVRADSWMAKNHFGATWSNFLKIRLGSRFPLLKSLNFWVRSQRNR